MLENTGFGTAARQTDPDRQTLYKATMTRPASVADIRKTFLDFFASKGHTCLLYTSDAADE